MFTYINLRSEHWDTTIGVWSEEKYLIYAMDTVHGFMLRYAEMTSRFIEEVSYEDNNDHESICDIFDILFKEIGKNLKQ